ncbi:MAG TPA: hypothetical protein VFQ61_31810, partial [Polyangiaceae bacterium]|nr:hypothetical protein [Polyangiaceae bacterium]
MQTPAPPRLTRRLCLLSIVPLWCLLFTRPSFGRGDLPTLGRPQGRPRVKLDRLTFSPEAEQARAYEPQLRKVLQREARRVDWGAGRGSAIQFRFSVEALRFEHRGALLKVHCSALGELPG